MTSISSRNMETSINAKHKVLNCSPLIILGGIKSLVFRQGTYFLLPELRVDASSQTVHYQSQAKEAAAPSVHSSAHHRLCHLRGVAPHVREEEAHVSGAQHPDPPHHRG